MKLSKIYFVLTLLLTIALLNSCKNAEGGTVAETGVTDSEILIGSWGPMTGPAALWGNILKGMDAYFKMINEEGGINGRNIKFVYKDDAYDPSRTVPAVRELVQRDEVFAVCGGIGTATNMAVVDFLSENSVPWISPMSGATHWTHPTKENIFTSFPLYFDEGNVMAEYVVNELKATKIGIIYQNDDFGKSGLVGAQHVLEENNMEFVAALPVEITDTDLSSHVARLKDSGAEAVFLWVLPRQAAIILGSSAVIDFNPSWLATLALSDMTLMHDVTKGAWEGVYFNYPSAVMYNDESNETMMKFKAAYAKYYPDERWGTFSASGFLWSEPLVEGLKRAGKNLTRASFLEAMANIQGFTGSNGLVINFSKDQHLGTRAISIMQCESAESATSVSGLIEANSDVTEMIEMLEGS